MDHDLHKGKRREGEFAAPPAPTGESGKTLDASIVDSAEIERAQDKLQCTLTAELARLGAQLVELRSGAYLISSGGTRRHFDSFEACRQFCAQLGVRT